MKIAIVQTGRIGDMILLTPMFKAVKEKFPDSELTVIAGPHNHGIVRDNPHVDRIWVFSRSPLSIVKLYLNLKFNKFDYWIDPKDHLSKQSNLMANFARAAKKIGFPNQSGDFNIPLPTVENELHHTQIGLNALSPLGITIPETPPKPELFESPDSREFIDNSLRDVNKKILLLNISGSREQKMWDNCCWSEFFHAINHSRCQVIVCSAPSESKRADDLTMEIEGSVYIKTRNINDMFSLVKRADVVISPDTAVVHIASAFDKPLLALYSGLDDFYAKFHPTSSVYVTVRADSGDEGIKSIKPEAVISGYNKLINKI